MFRPIAAIFRFEFVSAVSYVNEVLPLGKTGISFHTIPEKWWLFHADASKPSFKALLLNNGNVKRSHLPIHLRKNHAIICPSC